MQDLVLSEPLSSQLHATAVPVLVHYLRQLLQMLDKAAAHGGPALLQGRLAPDMFTLGQQVQIAAGFAQRAVAPLVGAEPPSLGEGDAPDLAALRRRVAAALAFVGGLAPAQFEAAPALLRTRAGEAWLEFVPLDFLRLYALPNFFFHLGMAYALLRQQGVPLGKPDFDGWHQYPAGFSFV